MKALRTPDERFDNLPGYDIAPNYVDDLPGYEGLRVHFLDEGPADAATTWLCLHGQPTWSYLYRKMLPVFTAAGDRVIAPDYLGFGRSDKPVDDDVYGFHFHRKMLIALIERLDLKGMHLVCQDWGGLLGLTLPMEFPDRFEAALIMNTALGTGDVPLGEGFLKWREYANSQPDLDIGKLMKRSVAGMTDAEAAAYDAPFPDVTYKAGVRRFPPMVPDHPEAEGAELSRTARDWWSNEWQGKAMMAIGMQDPVLGPPAMSYLHRFIRNCAEPMEISEAGHFVQEHGQPIAKKAVEVLGE